MEFFRGQPFFKLFATGSLEFDEHFPFLHIYQHTLPFNRSRGQQPLRELFRALTCEACQRVLRDVKSHSDSYSARITDDSASNFKYLVGGEYSMPPEMRKAHPYHVYDAIQAQPDLIERILQKREAIERVADAVAEKDRITFVGIGTSLHAARVAESWMREFSSGRLWAHYEQSFELVHHPIAFTAKDAVVIITHTGTTAASVEALRMARAAGALTVAITGEMSGEAVRGADFQIQTCEQEVAFAYTKSYATALAVLAILVARVVERRKLLANGFSPREITQAPPLMREALKLEPHVRELAKGIT